MLLKIREKLIQLQVHSGFFCVALAVGLVIWQAWGLKASGPPVGDDMVAHLIRAEYAINNFLAAGRPDGWQTSFALGYQQHLFIGPLLTWFVAIIYAASFGTLKIVTAYKIVIVLLMAALPVSSFYLARSFKLDRKTAGLASLLSLTVNSPYGGIGIQGLFGVGLTANLIGAIAFCFALGTLLRLADYPSKPRALLAGVGIALLTVSHGISMILLCVLMSVLLVLIVLESRMHALRGYDGIADFDSCIKEMERFVPYIVSACLLAFALSAWILIPLMVHLDLRGMITGWGHTPLVQRAGDIWHGRILFAPGTAPWILIGICYCLVRSFRGQKLALPLALGPILFLLLGELFFLVSPGNVVSQQIPNRGLGYAGLIGMYCLALFIADATRRLGIWGNIIVFSAVLYFTVAPLLEWRKNIRTVNPTPVALAAAHELNRRVPPSARYVMQRDFPQEISQFGMSHPDFWMAWQSGKNTLNVFNVESSVTPVPAYYCDTMITESPEIAADKLAGYGVTHVLLINTQKAPGMLVSPRFLKVWDSPPMAILSVSPVAGQPEPSSLLTCSVPVQAARTNSDPEHIMLRTNSLSDGVATVAVAWSPKWSAKLDSVPLSLTKDQEGLLSFPLSKGSHTVTLDFCKDVWDYTGITISILTITTLMLLAGWKIVRIRRNASNSLLK